MKKESFGKEEKLLPESYFFSKVSMMAKEKKELLTLIRAKGAYLRGSFVLSSGKRTEHYFDGKKIMLDPAGLYLLSSLFYPLLSSFSYEGVSGKSVGADPLISGLVLFSYGQKKPLQGFFVRSESKKHGTEKQIEGGEVRGLKIALVDDVLTTGKALLFAASVLRRAGAFVDRAFVIVDREEGGRENLKKEALEVRALLTMEEIARFFLNS